MNRALKENLIFAGFVFVLFGGALGIGTYMNSQEPNCPDFSEKDVGTKLLSHDLGLVTIEEESCHIVEVYEHICYIDAGYQCKGPKLICTDKTLSRITKCPSGSITNSVTRTGGKFPHEVVQ